MSSEQRHLPVEIGGTAMSADLSQRSGVEAIFEVVDRVGLPLKALVNNAGVFTGADPEAVTGPFGTSIWL